MIVMKIKNGKAIFEERKLPQKRQKPEIKYYFRNQNEREFFEERAAIMEFDGGLSRSQAEQEAYERLLILRNGQLN